MQEGPVRCLPSFFPSLSTQYIGLQLPYLQDLWIYLPAPNLCIIPFLCFLFFTVINKHINLCLLLLLLFIIIIIIFLPEQHSVKKEQKSECRLIYPSSFLLCALSPSQIPKHFKRLNTEAQRTIIFDPFHSVTVAVSSPLAIHPLTQYHIDLRNSVSYV